ncbi:MAG: hypothetical protein GEV09_11225 [Pseudonocardiaceae bacterium]|nr:hypothetical protein [Pseudonocardiaceae bacterium]
MTTETSTSEAPASTPENIDRAVQRVRSEQRRATQLLAGGPKCRRLSALYEHEARLWTLLTLHTPRGIYQHAAIEAECAARARAREYAELARQWAAHTDAREEHAP